MASPYTLDLNILRTIYIKRSSQKLSVFKNPVHMPFFATFKMFFMSLLNGATDIYTNVDAYVTRCVRDDVAVSTSGSWRVPLPWVEPWLLSGRLQGQRPERRCQAERTSSWALHPALIVD